jgi:hypothetical protein
MRALRRQLVRLLDWRDAHLRFDDAVRGWPTKLRGVKPRGAPHTAWQLVEHLRICQWDILEFCRNPNYKEMPFEDYWPRTVSPPSGAAWEKSLRAFRADNQAMQKLLTSPKTDLFAPIPWGSGQTILREAVLVADHNAYHVGQLVLLRRLVGAWKKS